MNRFTINMKLGSGPSTIMVRTAKIINTQTKKPVAIVTEHEKLWEYALRVNKEKDIQADIYWLKPLEYNEKYHPFALTMDINI